MMGNRKDHIRVRKQRQRKTKSDKYLVNTLDYKKKIPRWGFHVHVMTKKHLRVTYTMVSLQKYHGITMVKKP